MLHRHLAFASAALFGVPVLGRDATAGGPGVAPASQLTVNREAALPAGAPPLKDATIFITIEDVTELDEKGPERIARLELRRVSNGGAEAGRIKFSLGPIASPPPDAFYNVRVHVDVDGDGQVSKGDYLSLGRYNVLVREGEDATIRLEAVQ